MLWYKIIMEVTKPELAPIKWGAIYYPFNNHVHTCKLEQEKCRELAVEIRTVREKIQQSIDTGLWIAKPSSRNCFWCGYKDICPNYKR